MPKGPKGEKRPADVIGNAVKVMRIATGEDDETPPTSSIAMARASKGGTARAAKLDVLQKGQIAKKAASARWQKK
jgi:hypothetical protein